jgi:hypothetical protein
MYLSGDDAVLWDRYQLIPWHSKSIVCKQVFDAIRRFPNNYDYCAMPERKLSFYLLQK